MATANVLFSAIVYVNGADHSIAGWVIPRRFVKFDIEFIDGHGSR